MADDRVRIVVELENRASSQVAALEKEIREALGRVIGPAGGYVGVYKDQEKALRSYSTELEKLKRRYNELIPTIRALAANFNVVGAAATKAASQMANTESAIHRSTAAYHRSIAAQRHSAEAATRVKLANQQLASEWNRTQNLAIRGSVLDQQKALVLARTEGQLTRNALATLRLKLATEEYNSTKDREMIRLAKNENLLMRNQLMAQRLAGANAHLRIGTQGASASFQTFAGSIGAVAAKFGIFLSTAIIARRLMQSFTQTIREGLTIVDKMAVQAASMAGAMLIADPTMDFTQALGNANKIIEKTVIMSRGFVGSARELQLLAEAAVTFGVKLDFTTQKGQDQFITFANILKLVTQGQNFEIQAFQEVRAIMQGQNFQGAMLARRLQAVGVNVREMVPLWVQQGTLIEEINKRLGGYAGTTLVVQQTLGAQLKLTKSIAEMTLAMGLGWTGDPGQYTGAYKDIRDLVMQINDSLIDGADYSRQQKTIVEGIRESYEGVKDAVLALRALLQRLSDELEMVADAFKFIFDGFLKMSNKIESGSASILDYFGITEGAEARIDQFYKKLREGPGGLKLPPEMEELIDMGTNRSWLANFRRDLEGAVYGKGYQPLLEEMRKAREEATKFERYLSSAQAIGTQTYGGAGFYARQLDPNVDPTQRFRAESPKATFLPATPEIEALRAKVEKALEELRLLHQEKLAYTVGEMTGDVFKARRELIEKYRGLVELPEGAKIPVPTSDLRLWVETNIGVVDTADWVKKKKQFNDLIDLIIKGWKDIPVRLQEIKDRKFIESIIGLTQDTDRMYEEYRERHEGGGDKLSATLARITQKIRAEKDKYLKVLYPDREEKYSREGMEKNARLAIEHLTDLEKKLKVEAIGKAYEAELPGMQKFRQHIEDLTDATAKFVREANEPVRWGWNEQELGLAEAMAKVTEKFTDKMRELRQENEKWLRSKDTDKPEGLPDEEYLEALARMLKGQQVALDKLREQWDPVMKSIDAAWRGTFDGMRSFWSDLFFDGLKGELKSLSDYFVAFTDIVRRAFADMVGDMMKEWMKAKFGNPLKEGMESFLKPIASIFGVGAGAELAAFSEAQALFYGYKHGGIIPGGFVPIRAFASGGVADRPTLGLIGEGGGAEAVIPLRGGKVPVELRGGGGGPSTLNVNFNITAADAKDMDRVIMERRGLITSMFRQELANAGPSRTAIRRWGG